MQWTSIETITCKATVNLNDSFATILGRGIYLRVIQGLPKVQQVIAPYLEPGN